MAIQLTERPYKFSFTKNEARYIFFVTNPLSAGCLVDIKLFSHPASSEAAPPELITNVKLYPTPDGKVVFYANSYLESYLEADMPEPGSTVVKKALKQHRYFWIEYRQVTTISPNNPWILTERTRKRISILGGIETEKYERNNFFENFLVPDKRFLTWHPTGMLVGINQEQYITWLRTGDAVAGTKLVAKVVYDDSTEDEIEIEISDADQSFLFHLPAGAEQLGLVDLNDTKTIYYYELSIKDDENSVLVNPFRFYIDWDHSYEKFDWIYLNSISGLSSVRVKGEYIREVDREVTTGNGLNLSIDLNEKIKNSELIDAGITLAKRFKGDAGWLHTPADQEAVADILRTTDLFEHIDDKWIRVKLLNKTQPLSGSSDKKFSFPLEWMYAWTNDVHTPVKQWFGAGNNAGEVYDDPVSACPAPTNLTASIVEEVNGLAFVNFNWSHIGNVNVIIQAKSNVSTVWTNEFNDSINGLPLQIAFVADGRLMNWRLKLKCANEDESVYVNGPDFTLPSNGNACAIATNLSWTKGTPSGGIIPFTFTWNHAVPAPNFTFRYREIGSNIWIESNVAALSKVLNLADDGKTYEWGIISLCTGGGISTFVMGVNFTSSSAVTCSNPYALRAEIISIVEDTATVRFEWNHPGAIEYILTWTTRNGESGGSTTEDKFLEIDFPTSYGRIYWKVSAQCTSVDYSPEINGRPVNL